MIIRFGSILFLFLSLLSAEALSQDAASQAQDSSSTDQGLQTAAKRLTLSPSQMNERIVARDFPDIPAHVRNIDAQGRMMVLIRVDADGKPEFVGTGALTELSQVPVFGKCPNVVKDATLAEYVRNAIRAWKFRPLIVDGEPVPYRGYVSVIFWYGSFLDQPPF